MKNTRAKAGSQDALVRRIFQRLDCDIRDRHTLKHVWASIDSGVMQNELRPDWERIIREGIDAAMRSPNSGMSDPQSQYPPGNTPPQAKESQ